VHPWITRRTTTSPPTLHDPLADGELFVEQLPAARTRAEDRLTAIFSG
jgi:hypothetical protein